MALIKEYDYDNTGYTGNYWRIINVTLGNNSLSATLGLYKDQTNRFENKSILETLTFSFSENDNPITDFDWDNVNVATVSDLEDLLYQTVYLHIKNIIANLPETGELTRNQTEALNLVGYEDLL